MKTISRLLLPILVLVAACSDNSGTNPDPNNSGSDSLVYKDGVVNRDYNGSRKGVQITAIYYDQELNDSLRGPFDEWIVIESDVPRSTSGWKLNAGDLGQDYLLPSTINKRLIIYTQRDSILNTDSTLGLQLRRWIWNNADPDTARLYDATGALVDKMTYDEK